MRAQFSALCFKVIFIALFYSCQISSFGQDASLLNNNKNLITKYFDMVINAHNLDRKGDFFQNDYIWHTMDGKDVHSSKDSGHIARLRWLFAAIPDVRYSIDHILAEGDMVAVNTSATGIARSEMFGLPAAQKKVQYNQMFFYRVIDGKIAEQWEVVDPGGIEAQLKAK